MTEEVKGTKPEDELNDEEFGLCSGGEEHYDQKAVETVPFDSAQFELPEDFEIEEDDEDD